MDLGNAVYSNDFHCTVGGVRRNMSLYNLYILSCSFLCFSSSFGLGSQETVSAIHAGMYKCSSWQEKERNLFLNMCDEV